MFYGGSFFKYFIVLKEIIDLIFLKSINQNFGIIMDSDCKKKGERIVINKIEIQKYFDENDFFCWIIIYWELENYFDFVRFKKLVLMYYKKNEVGIDQSEYGDWNIVIDEDNFLNFR